MLSCREAEHGEEHQHDEREHSPAPAHGGRVGPPQLFGEQHDGHEKAGVSAEDQVTAVQCVAEHGSLVHEDGFDALRRVVWRSGSAMGRRSWKERPPAHDSLR